MIAKLAPNHHLLFDMIQARLALTLDEHRYADVVRAVEELIAAGEIRHFEELMTTLSEQSMNHRLWQKFIRIATISETYFFRDRSQLNALQLTVLPSLIAERRKEGRLQLRLWSAGCSTGEEPYSLAIMLREMLPDINLWDITILATDLNASNLERARNGVYRSWSFRTETPLTVRQRWFIEEPAGYRIDRLIRQMVTFGPLNLASDEYPSLANGTTGMDVILCRNVLIYFDNPTVARVIGRFHGALNRDGWLVIGHSESAHMMNQDFEPRNFENAVLYQKGARAPERETFPAKSVTSTLPAFQPRPAKTAPLPSLSVNPVKKATTAPLTSPAAPADPLEQARRAADAERWQDALRWLAEAEKKHKLSPEVYYLRGVVEIQQQEVEKGIASLRRAIYCDGSFVMAHFALGEVYEKQGNYKRASYEWNQAQVILSNLRPGEPVACAGDLSVEMLAGLIQFRLDSITAKK